MISVYLPLVCPKKVPPQLSTYIPYIRSEYIVADDKMYRISRKPLNGCTSSVHGDGTRDNVYVGAQCDKTIKQQKYGLLSCIHLSKSQEKRFQSTGPFNASDH